MKHFISTLVLLSATLGCMAQTVTSSSERTFSSEKTLTTISRMVPADGNNTITCYHSLGRNNILYHHRSEFILRGENVSNAFDFNNPSNLYNYIHAANRFITQNMTTTSRIGHYPTWHESDVDIRLDLNPIDDTLYVAYESVDKEAGECEHSKFTSLYRIYHGDFIYISPSLTMTDALLAWRYFEKENRLSGMQYSPIDKTVNLLFCDRSNPEEITSMLQSIKSLHDGFHPSLLADYRELPSLDIDGGDLLLAGRSLRDSSLLQFFQNTQHPLPSCYSTRHTTYSEALDPLVDSVVEERGVDQLNWLILPWGSIILQRRQINWYKSCVTFD